MNNLLKYFSTAPVLMTVWLSLTSAFIIVTNFLYPGLLVFPTF